MAIQIESKRPLIEERNRIAEELHDRVSQHLFGIIYAIHSMKCGWHGMSEEQKLEQMQVIQEAAATASRELRATIHSLSSNKNGDCWIGIIRSHLANQAKLNGIDIVFQAPKSDSRLSIHYQKALYRIILEGVGNAIRHGGSSRVKVDLTVLPRAVKLAIADNGKGFDVRSKPSKPGSGFGLNNMRALAVSLGGTFSIDSKKGGGTEILVWLPLADARDETGQNTKSG
ncbi:sensor histidine kinase [Paenibacillus humicola]|uniref:sensor histidine kinase n=1 Tax=Paenibacillus humicola TaxID=3110540 RepID=UPI00237A87E4|nr:sensor histidine kinase [Paenibacillus humicola]